MAETLPDFVQGISVKDKEKKERGNKEGCKAPTMESEKGSKKSGEIKNKNFLQNLLGYTRAVFISPLVCFRMAPCSILSSLL